MKIFLIKISIPLFFCVQVLFAKSNSIEREKYKFVKIGVEEGLSQSTVYSILQDKDGFMWFGTANGLNRYDGYEFVVYTNNPKDSTSVSDNGITSIFEDKKGILWIGTTNGILNKFNKTTESFTHYDIAASSSWFNISDERVLNFPISFSRYHYSTITSIAEDANGELWIGTWGKGLIKFNPKTKQKKYFYSLNNNSNTLTSNKISEIIIDENNFMWVGTFGGGLDRAKLNKTNNNIKFTNYNNHNIGKDITSLCKDRNNNIWVATYDNGISLLKNIDIYRKPSNVKFINYNIKTASSIGLKRNDIITIVEDEDGIWFGTFGGGLYKFDKKYKFINLKSKPLDESSLSENEVISLYIDQSGLLWVGTNLGSGINKLQKEHNRFFTFPIKTIKNQSLNDNIVWEIYEDDNNNLWIGTFRGGVNIYNPANKKFTYLTKNNGLLSNHIRDIIKDKYGNYWIGTYSGGLTFYNAATNKIKNFSYKENNAGSVSANQIQSLFIEKDSILWIGTFGGGLDKLNLTDFYKTGETHFVNYEHNPSNPFSLNDNRIYTIFQSKNGTMWIGTFGGGLNKFVVEKGVFRFYKHSNNLNSISDNRVMTINETNDGKLLLGTFGGGLDIFNPENEKFTHLREEINLPCNDVYGILKDDYNRFWISTDVGIFKIEADLKDFTQYDLNDGLQSLEFNGGAYLKSKDGTFYFGGVKGLNYFNPDSIITNNYSPQVVISKIKIFDKKVIGTKRKLVLDRTQNYFSFEFASLDFENPVKNKYKYILEGLDKKWSTTDAKNRKVNYTNLDPGHYKFIVLGTNSAGLWSKKNASIDIEILAPFWMKWWFIALVIISIISLIAFFIYQRFRYFIAMDKLKNNLAADLHDNIGSGLTEISILSEIASHEINKPELATKHLAQVSDLSRNLVDVMSDIVWVVNPKQDSLYDLIVRLKDSYGEILQQLGIKLETSNLEKLNTIRLPIEYRQNVYLIFKEAFNNSIKHSKCTLIKINITIKGSKITISLEDNGIGFDMKKPENGNGLLNIKERAKKINAEISILSNKNRGTKITFIGTI